VNMKKHAFTLIELLIVVAIIAILAAIAVPNFLEAQIRSKVSRAQADMRSLATAIESYRVDNNSYPAAISGDVFYWDTPDSNDTVTCATGGSVKNANYGTVLRSNRFYTGAQWRCTFMVANNVAQMTTPVAYITSYPADPFAKTDGIVFGYNNMNNASWVLWSFGPDNDEQYGGQMGQGANSTATGGFKIACGGGTSETDRILCLDWFKDRIYNSAPAGWGASKGCLVCSPGLTNPTATLLTAGFTYDTTNGSKSCGDIWRVKQ
jgi:prepilin-type N-terminal cleavage/methylation domain-containing protein